jgi:hypothetical protein
MKKLAVLVPWDSKFMFTHTAFNLMNLHHPTGYEVRYIMGEGWCPAIRHNSAVGMAANWGADLMCFMGADHFVDEDVLVKLVYHIDARGYDMACGWVPSRGTVGPKKEPYPFLAFKIRSTNKINPNIPGVLQFDEENWDILGYGAESQEIDVIGTGILMFKTEMIESMKKPLFFEFVQREPLFNRIPVQDSHFVWRCTVEGGNTLWLDTTIRASHLDVFPIDETYGERFKDKTGENWTAMKSIGSPSQSKGEEDDKRIPSVVCSDMQQPTTS